MNWFDSQEYQQGMAIVRKHSDVLCDETLKAHTLTTEDFSVNTAAKALQHMGIAAQSLINLQELCPSFIQPHDLDQLHEHLLNTQLELANWVCS